MEIPKAKIQESQFRWPVFADATCAGLSVLIPLPLVDLVFETIFRRRIPGTISRFRRRQIDLDTRRRLARPLAATVSWAGCVAVPIMAARYIVRRAWRKIIYVFAVKDATSALTEYWHRAYLIDHMARAGHLDRGADTGLAVRVFRGVLLDIDPSPLLGLARQTVANVHHVLRLLIRARRLGAVGVTNSLGGAFSSNWRLAESSMRETAALYNRWYAREVAERDAKARAS